MRTTNLFRNSSFFKYLFGLDILALAVLTIVPDSAEQGMSVPHLTESGFFLHLFAYLVLAVFGYLAYPRRSFAILSFVFLYSIAMEILQLFIPYRSFNYLDIAANFMGILLLILFLASIKMLHPNIRNGTEYDK